MSEFEKTTGARQRYEHSLVLGKLVHSCNCSYCPEKALVKTSPPWGFPSPVQAGISVAHSDACEVKQEFWVELYERVRVGDETVRIFGEVSIDEHLV
jgi:hypothetical protein